MVNIKMKSPEVVLQADRCPLVLQQLRPCIAPTSDQTGCLPPPPGGSIGRDPDIPMIYLTEVGICRVAWAKPLCADHSRPVLVQHQPFTFPARALNPSLMITMFPIIISQRPYEVVNLAEKCMTRAVLWPPNLQVAAGRKS